MKMLEEDNFFNVCIIAHYKLNEMADSIVNNIDDVSLKDIKKYWKYHKKYVESCASMVEIASEEAKLKEAKDNVG